MKNDSNLVTGHHHPQSIGLSPFHAGMALPNINASLGMMQHNGHPMMMPRGGQMGAPGPPPMRPQISPTPMMSTQVHQANQPSNARQGVVQAPSPSPPKKPSETKETDTMDGSSARGIFGWTTIDDVSIPYLMRDDKKFVAVRMVEMKLLSKFPSTYPEELQNKPPLMSHYVTGKEAKLLNEINAEHCAMEFGRQSFNGRDLIVKLEDFIDFYSIVRKHFPESAGKKSVKPKPPAPVEGGWIQVNNTVVPFVLRGSVRYVPLSVVRYAAGLLSEVPVEGHLPNPEECTYLNEHCKKAGLTFTFAKATKLIPSEVITMKSDVPVHIQDLPKDDPFSYAEIKMTPEEDASQNSLVVSSASQPYPVMTQGMSASQVTGSMHGNIPRQTMPTTSSQFWMNPHMGIYPAQNTNIPQQYTRPPQPFMNQPMQMINNGQSEQMRNYLQQVARNASPASRPEVNNNGSMKTGQSVAESRPLSAGARSSTPGELVPAVPGQRRLSGSSVSTSRGSTPPQVANRMPLIGPPGWHPTMGNPDDYQRKLHMLAGQQNSGVSRQTMSSPGNAARAPLAQLARMGPSFSQSSSSAGMSSVIRGPSKGSKRSPTITPNLSRSSSADSLSSGKTGNGNPPTKSSHKEGKIKPVEFFGKTLSCLIKGPAKDSYALVEAVARVYFPYCTLDEFQFALETILKLPVTTLSGDEEKAFIDFYGLPTKTLMCNKVVKLNEFELIMPKLNEIFKDKADVYAKRVSRKRERDSAKSSSEKKSRDDGGQGTSAERSAFVEKSGGEGSSLALNLFKEKAKNALKEIMGGKRSAGEEDGSQPPSKSRKRLEAAVLKLKQQQLSQDDSSGIDSPGSQNQDDSGLVSDSVQVTKDTPESLQEIDTEEPQVLNIVPVEEESSVAVDANLPEIGTDALIPSLKERNETLSDMSEDLSVKTVGDMQPDNASNDVSENAGMLAEDSVVLSEPEQISAEAMGKTAGDCTLEDESSEIVQLNTLGSSHIGSDECDQASSLVSASQITQALTEGVFQGDLPDPGKSTEAKPDEELGKSDDTGLVTLPQDQSGALTEPEGLRGDEHDSCDLTVDIGNLSVPEMSLSAVENKEDEQICSSVTLMDSEQPIAMPELPVISKDRSDSFMEMSDKLGNQEHVEESISICNEPEEPSEAKDLPPFEPESSDVADVTLSDKLESSNATHVDQPESSDIASATLSDKPELSDIASATLLNKPELSDVANTAHFDKPESSDVGNTTVSEKQESSDVVNTTLSDKQESPDVANATQSEKPESDVANATQSGMPELSDVANAMQSEKPESRKQELSDVANATQSEQPESDVANATQSVMPELSDVANAMQSEKPESSDVVNAKQSEKPDSSDVVNATLSEKQESSDVANAIQSEKPESSEDARATFSEKEESSEVALYDKSEPLETACATVADKPESSDIAESSEGANAALSDRPEPLDVADATVSDKEVKDAEVLTDSQSKIPASSLDSSVQQLNEPMDVAEETKDVDNRPSPPEQKKQVSESQGLEVPNPALDVLSDGTALDVKESSQNCSVVTPKLGEVTGLPVVETPVVENLAAETPVVENLAAETPVVENLAAETPVVENLAVETPVMENDTSDNPVSENPLQDTTKSEAGKCQATEEDMMMDGGMTEDVGKINDSHKPQENTDSNQQSLMTDDTAETDVKVKEDVAEQTEQGKVEDHTQNMSSSKAALSNDVELRSDGVDGEQDKSFVNDDEALGELVLDESDCPSDHEEGVGPSKTDVPLIESGTGMSASDQASQSTGNEKLQSSKESCEDNGDEPSGITSSTPTETAEVTEASEQACDTPAEEACQEKQEPEEHLPEVTKESQETLERNSHSGDKNGNQPSEEEIAKTKNCEGLSLSNESESKSTDAQEKQDTPCETPCEANEEKPSEGPVDEQSESQEPKAEVPESKGDSQ